MRGFTIDDSPLYVSRFSDVCSKCVHLNLDARAIKQACKAFPKGIPQEIWTGDNNHRQPYPGDNGIQFEQRKR